MRISDWSSDVCSSDLPSRQLREALEIAKTIGDEDSRTRALAALAMHVPAEPAESGTPRKIAEFAAQWMSGRWPDRLMMVASLVVIGLIFGGLAWVCWVWWMTAVWEWGFEAIGWKSFVAPLAILRSEEHTSELQSLMRISYAVF